MNVAVVGASNKPDKFSYKAVMLLKENGHRVFPVHVAIKEIEGLKVYPSLKDVPEPVDTVTMYVSREISDKMADEILGKKPRRVIFNPGAENPELAARLSPKGIEPVEACTLVMLKTRQF